MDSNVLKEYLSERKVEVMDILTALFDQDVVTERHEKALKKENTYSTPKQEGNQAA